MKQQHAVRGAEFFHRIKSASQSFRTDAMEQLEWKSYKSKMSLQQTLGWKFYRSKMSQTTRQSSKPIQTLSGGAGQMSNSSLPFCQQPLYTHKFCVTDNPNPKNRSATQDVQSKRVQTAAIHTSKPQPAGTGAKHVHHRRESLIFHGSHTFHPQAQ